MPHSHKVLLALLVALVLGAIAAYLLLEREWFQQLLPLSTPSAATTFSIFALFTIFIFDVLVLALEGALATKE